MAPFGPCDGASTWEQSRRLVVPPSASQVRAVGQTQTWLRGRNRAPRRRKTGLSSDIEAMIAVVQDHRRGRRLRASGRTESLAADEFEALYAAAYPAVYRYVLARLMGDREATADLVQETFTAAYTVLVRRGANPQSEMPLLFTIARRRLMDYFREGQRRRVASEKAWEPQVEAEATSEWIEVVDALRTLPAKWREALLLRYVSDLSVRDVAKVMGRSEGSTESLLARARKAFRRSFEGEDNNDE